MKFPVRLTAALFCAVLALGGCSTISDLFPSVKNKVAALQSGYSGAAALEAAYLDPKVPYCNGNGVKICKTKSGVQQILAADNTAYLSISTARKMEDETTFAAAQAALSAFQAAADSLPTNTK